ncbi:MAG: TIGR02679 domain-containing protein [Thermodesulfobacteriota bacterium]|nr:TIGR02679 domain-containing protein [Thermodesulfobacteriota bacterium]
MTASLISGLLDEYPGLRPYLKKICDRCRKRGTLTGMMKLGRLDRDSTTVLQAFFGMAPLSVSANGDVKISFDRFFKNMEPHATEEWINNLHQALDLKRESSAQDQARAGNTAVRILERLKIAYPDLPGPAEAVGGLDSLSRKVAGSRKNIQDELFQAAEIIRFLKQNKEPVTFSELGARFCRDSKALRGTELAKLIASWIEVMEQEQGEFRQEQTVWDRYRVVSDRLAVCATIFGQLIYEKNGKTYDWIYQLWQAGEPATLSWRNIAGIERMYHQTDGVLENYPLITCENEAPFGRLVREGHPGIILYTCGFPNDGVLTLYRLLAPTTASRLHWGDSDLAGLRIAAILHAAHPLQLWRCDFNTLRANKSRLLPLSFHRQQQISDFMTRYPDFPFIAELCFTQENGWLEQESL